MTHNLELPRNVLQALKKAAKAAGQTPSDWIVAHLPARLEASVPQTAEGEPKTLAERFEGRTGNIRSGGREPLSEDCGMRFAEHVEAKRRAGHL